MTGYKYTKILLICLILFFLCGQTYSPVKASEDPLPSWREGATKKRIIDFVKKVTSKSLPSYVPPEDRIVTSDIDGTLIPEIPTYMQVAFMINQIKENKEKHPEWRNNKPFKIIIEDEKKFLDEMNEKDIIDLFIATQEGMTQETYWKKLKYWLLNARHPRFNAPYTKLVYQPMIELFSYLHSNSFKVYLCTGSEIEFVRCFSISLFGIQPEYVIGSSIKYEFAESPEGSVIVGRHGLSTFNNASGKPENIHIQIGKRPILAIGNSNGDIQMFKYTSDRREKPSLILIIRHDDSEREYSSDDNAKDLLEAQEKRNWTIVSMKKDFKKIFRLR